MSKLAFSVCIRDAFFVLWWEQEINKGQEYVLVRVCVVVGVAVASVRGREKGKRQERKQRAGQHR